MPHRTSDSDDSDNQDDEQNAEHNNSDGEDSDSGPVPDATTGIVELESDEFPSYFFERNGRLFHSSTSPYPLPVDTPEQQRLRDLHNILRQLLGVLAPQQGSNQRIALDVCTGNGIWVLDMARDFPHVHFRGFDIVPIATRYPPRNVQFEISDVNSPLRWANGTFDLVHSRSVDMAVIDYRQFAHEVARLLRPGGLFVSYEWSPHPAFDPSLRRDPALHAPASARFHAAITAALAGRGLRALGRLVPSYLADAGAFTDIAASTYCVPVGAWPANHAMRRIGRACHAAQEQYASSIRPLLGEAGWTEDAVDELVTDYFLEMNSTRGLVCKLYTVHARRV
ncbi:S-adenosyl-L-methionine-dependent methyltransferase [Pholiota molesta]|nr:S-adenosyl-L-methionine-dependent methyltransferase [Pholiota molesta]